jgi:hypothetical protein
MTRSFRSPRHPASLRLLGLAAVLALGAACSKPDAGAAGGGQAAGADSAGSGGRPLVALIRAADWMGSEWGEDAIKLGLRESDMEEGPRSTPR